MKRHLLWWAVGFVVGCGGAPEAGEEAQFMEGRAGYTECGRAACVAGYEATFIHLESCEPASDASPAELNATECTAGQAGSVWSQHDDEPPEPIKSGLTDLPSDPAPTDKPPEPIK